MQLHWRDVVVREGGPAISTSLTSREAAELAKLATGLEVMEIGAAFGYSTVILAHTAKRVTSIDPHQWLNSYGVLMHNVGDYGVGHRVRTFVEGAETAVPHLAGRGETFDMVWIDGDHEFLAVERDIKLALSVLRPGGILALHDLGETTCPGVLQAVTAWGRTPDHVTDTMAVFLNVGGP